MVDTQLYITITKDENWESGNGKIGTVAEYKNKLGQVVLKRVYTTISGEARTIDPKTAISFYTYYVYDVYGNLTFVLPPKLSQQIVSGSSLVGNHQELLDELGYRYIYDHRNRLKNKKLPGKQPEVIFYDALDRVIAVGPVPSPFMDGNELGILLTRYDHFNRVAYTLWRPGWFSEGARQILEAPQTYISETRTPQVTVIDGVSVFYTNNVSPSSTDKLLTVNYYDDYDFPGAPSNIPGDVGENNEIDVYYNNTIKPKGMPTGSWVRVLEEEADQNATVSYTLYDVKSNPVRVHASNYLGGFSQTDTDFDFIGKVLTTYTTHKKTAASDVLEIKEDFAYTPQDRMEKHLHRVNSNNQEMLSFHEYDPLGQLMVKKVGDVSESTGNYLQKVDYKYNIRGWLTDINKVENLVESGAPQDLFGFKINYTQVTNTVNGSVNPLYNGNIAETLWRTSSDNIRRRYSYTYDLTNRLLDAWYSIPGSAVADSYNEHLTYDANGNILTLQRYGEVENYQQTLMIDDLVYEYDNGNKLLNVTDVESHDSGFKDVNISSNGDPTNDDDFEYDDFGNLVLDRNKGITEITYNHLHLPKKIIIDNAVEDDGFIEYLYDANGVKLMKKVTNTTSSPNEEKSTHYLDGFQYIEDNLEFFPHAEGYVKVSDFDAGLFFNYVYNFTDHLGNIRLRYTKNTQTPQQQIVILEEDHYYPFGLKHIGYNSNHEIFGKDETGNVVFVPVNNIFPETYKYKFGGMEIQDEFDVNLYDFGARNYDPALGRWMNIDPMAEAMRRHSPYNYAFNNPIFWIDPDGMIPIMGLQTGSYESYDFGDGHGMTQEDRDNEAAAKTASTNAYKNEFKNMRQENQAAMEGGLDGVGGGESKGGCWPFCNFLEIMKNVFTPFNRSNVEQLENKSRDIGIAQNVFDEGERIAEGAMKTSAIVIGSLYPAARLGSLASKAPALFRAAYGDVYRFASFAQISGIEAYLGANAWAASVSSAGATLTYRYGNQLTNSLTGYRGVQGYAPSFSRFYNVDYVGAAGRLFSTFFSDSPPIKLDR
ncbi:RHS repeat-associated core domain-containing protein [uncultured Planktosalinus sp.]|uniref:RHS repeat domain-containing protein n=1 Tax=uncultured Planktosalinus sp. TaxID=1810935 RepID=UPI0030D84C5D